MVYPGLKQSNYLIDMELKNPSNKSRVLDSTSDVKDIKKVSSLVLTKDESADKYGFQLEILQADGNDKEGNPKYQRYIITDEALDSLLDGRSVAYKNRVYDMLSGLNESGDINVRFGSDITSYRWADYTGDLFSQSTKPIMMGNFKPSEYFKDHLDSVAEAYENNKAEYYKEHQPIRIGYSLTRHSLPDPVRLTVHDDVFYDKDGPIDVEMIGRQTGIYPVSADGDMLYDSNGVRTSVPLDNGAKYVTGYQFVPVLALDEKTPKEVQKNPVANPYLVRYYGKLSKFEPAREYHDELIAPQYAVKLMESSNYDMTSDKSLVVGVTNTTVYDHNHMYTDRYTDVNNKYINAKDLKGQYTNSVLNESQRPAVPFDMLVSTKPPKGCVRTVNFAGELPDGIRSIPDKPFDDKIHRRNVAISVKAVQKAEAERLDKIVKGKNPVDKALNLGNSLIDKESEQNKQPSVGG